MLSQVCFLAVYISGTSVYRDQNLYSCGFHKNVITIISMYIINFVEEMKIASILSINLPLHTGRIRWSDDRRKH